MLTTVRFKMASYSYSKPIYLFYTFKHILDNYSQNTKTLYEIQVQLPVTC